MGLFSHQPRRVTDGTQKSRNWINRARASENVRVQRRAGDVNQAKNQARTDKELNGVASVERFAMEEGTEPFARVEHTRYDGGGRDNEDSSSGCFLRFAMLVHC